MSCVTELQAPLSTSSSELFDGAFSPATKSNGLLLLEVLLFFLLLLLLLLLLVLMLLLSSGVSREGVEEVSKISGDCCGRRAQTITKVA